jgi:hypothetical protein
VRDHVAKIIPLHLHMRALRELHQDFRPDRVFMKRRGRLRKNGTGQSEERIGIHGFF